VVKIALAQARQDLIHRSLFIQNRAESAVGDKFALMLDVGREQFILIFEIV